MTGGHGQRATLRESSLVEELGAAADGRDGNVLAGFKLFERWCAAQSLPARPATDRTILRFLHSRHGLITAQTAKNYVRDIVREHRAAGLAAPVSDDVRRYLAVLRRDRTLPGPAPKADAIFADDAQRISTALSTTGPDPGTVSLRAALAAAVACSSDPYAVGQLMRGDLTVTETHVRFRRPAGLPGGSTVTIDAARQPDLFSALTAWHAGTGDDVLGARVSDARVRATFRRAGLSAPRPGTPFDLDDAEVPWLLGNADPNLHRDLRDRAYLLVGLFTGLRHSSLEAIDIAHCRKTSGEYELDVRHVKQRPDGLSKLVPCSTPTIGGCNAPFCPGCALAAWLECLRRSHNRSSGPVFSTYYGGAWRPMTRQNARHRLRRLWKLGNGDPTARISSRSLRVGAVSSAIEAGCDLLEVAADVSNHDTLSVAFVYVRRRDAYSWDYQLVPRPRGSA